MAISKNGHDNSINYICKKHRDKGVLNSKWTHLKNATYGCKYCAGKGVTTADFIKALGDVNYNVISDYKGFESGIKCKCKLCENIWETTPASLKQGCGCPKCGITRAGILRRNSSKEFKKRMHDINPDILILEEYQTLKTPILCRCAKCNHEWKSRPDNLIYEKIRCPACSSSKSEILLGDILRKIDIGEVKYHVRFNDCRLKNTLEFDYAVYNRNDKILFMCEYDGEQHYSPINFSGKSYEFNLEQFEKTKLRDKVKNEYCKNNNIPLIRIPYWEKDNMESFLINKIKDMQLDKYP